jgi:hypothetical protein
MPIATTGFVITPKGDRYLQQLLKHWSHKFAIVEAGGGATIPFNPDVTLTLRANPEGIAMSLVSPNDGDDERFRKVFESHLDRFAFREVPLEYAWARQRD